MKGGIVNNFYDALAKLLFDELSKIKELEVLKGFYQKNVHLLDNNSDYFEKELREVFDDRFQEFLQLAGNADSLDLKELHDLAVNYSNVGSKARKWIELYALHLIKTENLDLESLSLWSNAIYSTNGLEADYVLEIVRYNAEQRFKTLLLASEE